MESLRKATRLLAVIVATITHGAACTIIHPAIPAGPFFQVHVEDRGRPVFGLRVTLKRNNFTRTIETGKDGTAHFQNVPAGDYQLGAGFDAGMADGATVIVTASGPNSTKIPLVWPRRPPFTVQTVKGSLRWHTYQPGERQSTLRVELLDARTGRSRGSTKTNGDGAFDLGIPAPGLYFLRVTPTDPATEGGMRIAENIPIEVDRRAAQVDLELEFGWTGCGLTFVALHTCPRQELSITRLSGQVLDQAGASIARATVRLFSTDRTIAEQLTSDEEGRFASMLRLEGNYELEVSAAGFTSLRQAVQATTPKEAVRSPSLRIQLGIGVCSHATVP